jgi:ketosteroid isomerase-like protein
MKLKTARALAIILGLYTVLFSGSTAYAAEMDIHAKVLAKLDADWSAAAEKKDPDLVASYYADDTIVYPPNETAAIGRTAAKKVWATYFAEPTFKLSWKTLHAEVSASGELGFTAGTYEDSFKGPDGKLVTETGKYLCTWKKGKDGKWKAIHDMWNSDAKQ